MTTNQAKRLKTGDRLYVKGQEVATFNYETIGHGRHKVRRTIIEWDAGRTQLLSDSPRGLRSEDYQYIALMFD